MQQVSRPRLLTAQPAPAPFLPVPIRSSRHRALVPVKRAWALHRAIIIRIGAALVVALAAAGLLQARDGIVSTAEIAGHLMAGRFASAGFGINEIAISGQIITGESVIAEALAIAPEDNIFGYDAVAARERIADLPAVESAIVRKVYPSRLIVEITEVAPVARWRIDGVTFLVDAAGTQIGEAVPADEHLPLVIGDGAADDALVMIRSLERHADLLPGLVALSRIGDRRWDMIYETGLRVRLPEAGLAQALSHLDAQQAEHRLLDRDLDLIDLRAPGIMALRPTVREDQET